MLVLHDGEPHRAVNHALTSVETAGTVQGESLPVLGFVCGSSTESLLSAHRNGIHHGHDVLAHDEVGFPSVVGVARLLPSTRENRFDALPVADNHEGLAVTECLRVVVAHLVGLAVEVKGAFALRSLPVRVTIV